MQKIYYCILMFFIVMLQCTFALQINKVIISGYGGQHDLDVKHAFLIGYASYNNTPFTSEVILYSSTLQSTFDYAVANDFHLIIRSTSGLSTGFRLAPDYPSVELVMPAGSNNYVQVFYGDVITSLVVITGAGADSNQTGYQLEFYSIDPITANNSSSYSNGYIAGQLAFIANTLNCSFDSARTLARSKGSENGLWNFYNGFGEIMPELIFANPLPVELTSFTAKVIGKIALLNWQTSTEINNYGFEVERSVISNKVRNLSWTKIGFINGFGNSYSLKNYSYEDKNVNPGKYSYRLKQIDNDGQFEYSKTIEVDLTAPAKFVLRQNYPNPFNSGTTICFNLIEAIHVNLTLFNILGQEIITLVNEFKEIGAHTINFDASDLNSGVYIYTLRVNGFSASQKMLLLK